MTDASKSNEKLLVWYVVGADPQLPTPKLFLTRADAERYARFRLPLENKDRRNARVMYKIVTGFEE